MSVIEKTTLKEDGDGKILVKVIDPTKEYTCNSRYGKAPHYPKEW